jgi:excisionase family DNA binding protein
MEQALLTIQEAAEILSLGRSKVYELVSTGRLPSVSIGRARRVPVEAITEFVAGLTNTVMAEQ